MRATPRPQKSSTAFNLLPAIDQLFSGLFLALVRTKHLLFIRASGHIIIWLPWNRIKPAEV